MVSELSPAAATTTNPNPKDIDNAVSPLTPTLMEGKRGLIMGVANRNSIAWGIARALSDQGAQLAFTYQGKALERRVRPLAESVSSDLVMLCDVEDELSMDAVFDCLDQEWKGLDFVVHAIAYSDKGELKGRYVDTTRDNFLRTLEVSCYSFTAVAQRASSLMETGGSLITLSFFGAERVVPNYNVMGIAKAALEASIRYLAVDLGPQDIRVNGISAGPMRTLAGSAIGSAREILKRTQETSPLNRTLCHEDIGGSALYLLSDLSRSVTGEVLHVDSGFNIVGMSQFPSGQDSK